MGGPEPVLAPGVKKPTGVDLYARFAFAGAMCCSITHGAVTPVDVVKTRIQLEPTVYNKGMVTAFRQVVAAEGAGALLTGFGPTVAGYFLQGAFKFGGYEFWKKTFIDVLGPESASRNRTAVYIASSAIAEFFADVALCPLEATRIRLVSQPTFATGLVPGFLRLLREEGALKGFYSGFGPILFKQIPYTIAKFVCYERFAETIYNSMSTPKEKLGNGTHTIINLTSGLGAGLVAAVVSQPADTLLSKVNKTKGAEGSVSSRIVKIAKELGPRGLFLGLTTRLVMVGSLTAFQFAIYGDIKRLLGATGGAEIAKAK
jgi:solute carrier family 25 phosphate transporter 3